MNALLWQIFWLFTRVAFLSWGGGPASLALMQRETTAVGWVNPEEFADAVAVGNAIPGPIAPQVSAYVGYKMAGIWGAVAAAAGTTLPTTLLMLVLVVYFFSIKDSLAVKAMLQAVRPVVVGLLLWTAYDMALTVFGVRKQPTDMPLAEAWMRSLGQGWDKLLIMAVSFALLTFTSINPAVIILGAAGLGFGLYYVLPILMR